MATRTVTDCDVCLEQGVGSIIQNGYTVWTEEGILHISDQTNTVNLDSTAVIEKKDCCKYHLKTLFDRYIQTKSINLAPPQEVETPAPAPLSLPESDGLPL